MSGGSDAAGLAVASTTALSSGTGCARSRTQGSQRGKRQRIQAASKPASSQSTYSEIAPMTALAIATQGDCAGTFSSRGLDGFFSTHSLTVCFGASSGSRKARFKAFGKRGSGACHSD